MSSNNVTGLQIALHATRSPVTLATHCENLLLDRSNANKIWILRKMLADMNPAEAMNFMLQLMDEYKTNQDILDNMNKVSPREAKYYDNF